MENGPYQGLPILITDFYSADSYIVQGCVCKVNNSTDKSSLSIFYCLNTCTFNFGQRVKVGDRLLGRGSKWEIGSWAEGQSGG